MRKLIETLINYGYLSREIKDLLIIAFYPETKTMKFENEEIGIIARRIYDMHEKIKMLENGTSKKQHSQSEDQGFKA